MKISIYTMLKYNFFTSDYLQRIEKRMAIYYPMDPILIQKKTIGTIIIALIGSALASIFLFIFGGLSLYYIVFSVAILFLVHLHILYEIFDREEIKLIEELEKFLTEIQFQYSYYGMLEESIEDAMRKCSVEMNLHGDVILKLLFHEEERAGEYYRISPNSFFTIFYTICATVLFYGDKKEGGKSVLLNNINYLQEEIRIEVLKRKKSNYLFTGLSTITLSPFFALKPIEWWAINTTKEMENYYKGEFGMITTLFVFASVIVGYWVVHKLKFEVRPMDSTQGFLQRLTQVKWISLCFNKIINQNYSKYLKKHERLKGYGEEENIKKFMITQILMALFFGIGVQFFIFELLYVQDISILKGYRWYFLLISLLGGTMGYYVPEVRLILKQQILEMERDKEVICFQTVILMLMHFDFVTVQVMIEWMERFAIQFKAVLSRASTSLEYVGYEAIEELKKSQTYLPFVRILDGILACDKIPVHQAFSDMEGERSYYLEKHKQENEAYLLDKVAIAKIIAFVPLIITIACKLIVPFVFEGLSQLDVYSQGFQNMM